MIAALSTARLAGAAAVVFAYLMLCAWVLRGVLNERRAARDKAAQLAPADGRDATLVLYASQTGTAEALAWHTGRLLHAAGEPVNVLSLADATAARLATATRALFVVSTYGEGDPPDAGAAFARRVMDAAPDLSGLQYAVLALGDATYTNYCGFGRRLETWLSGCGAQAQFDRIDVDRTDSEAIARWQHHLGHIATLGDVPAWDSAPYEDWTLAVREHLNPGSAGAPVFHIELEPPAGSTPIWHSGDLIQLRAPGDPDHAREYSIGSIAADGRVHLLVRQQTRADGTPGVASGWLTGLSGPHPAPRLDVGGVVSLRLRAHRNFRLGDNAVRPLILIGNGTGLAGLRGHLRARAAAGVTSRNWLIFGERQAAHDWHYQTEMRQWQTDGLLTRLDLAFSRDQDERTYVQHRLAAAADEIRAWVADGAALYVCGSLQGMAQAVDDTLARVLGREALDELAGAGRYRRDVY
ncbi:MAG: flavodoxin domain-containing protein [Burkholderiales bacterium]|nr:flavodoxin domain-containing protein [Burkholderiales bacterium]